MEYYKQNISEVIEGLGSDIERGLTAVDVRQRQGKWGPNTLPEPKKGSRLLRFAKQFTEFIILVLIAAAAAAAVLGEWVDALAVTAIVVLNGAIGFLQEEKAERVIEALKKLSAPAAKVLRDSSLAVIPAAEAVPGDIVMLEAGDSIPADCRIIESISLRIDESSLTGESHPADKSIEPLKDTLPLGDRINMAYLGTKAVYGRGKAVVVRTGASTEMGAIARLIEEVKPEPTPLQKRLSEFARFLVYGAGGICALIFFLGLLRGEGAVDMFLTAVSLAVAAIPEGLPAVVTITLALGVQRMARRNALVRKLPSVETLGAATVIASDKTGTITQNQMTVRKVFLMGETISVSGSGYSPKGRFFSGSHEINPRENPPLLLAMKAGLLCNAAELKNNGADDWQAIGDPTEAALLSLALKAGLDKKDLRFSLVGEAPFDAGRKMMTAVYRDPEGNYCAFVKGAPEKILSLSSRVLDGKSERPLTEKDTKFILNANDEFSRDALRVIALAYRASNSPLDITSLHLVEKDLTFVALAGISDPPREEVYTAVDKAKDAGITPVMITGDHKLTAVAVAKETGIWSEGDIALSGEELDGIGEDEFLRELPRIKVYARVNPEHKLRIIRAWKARGATIAMTGDGVNDAPALKEADIGVAMGISGTDVAKEASDMVLTNDNFASIVSAVEEGRAIFDNIRKVVHFLLSCNLGEILVLLVSTLAGMPLPLLPVQILWTNLVTDGLPALGLAMEPVDPAVMDRMPRTRDERIVTRPLLWVMLLQGAFIALCTLAVYSAELYYLNSSIPKARTMAFMVLVFSQMFHVYNCRHMWGSAFKGVFSNKTLNIAVAVILGGQFLLVHIPALTPVFKVAPLDLADWSIVFGASVQTLVLMEAVKLIRGGRR